MNQEQIPESPPSVGALVDGLDKRDACAACEVEAKLGGGSAQVTTPAHTCAKATSVTVAQRLESWALAGQLGAAVGAPSCPPGTVLAR